MDAFAAERFRRADAVFDAALDLPPDERAAFVERACSDDMELRADVQRLLRAYGQSDDFLDTSAAALAAPLLANGTTAARGGVATIPDRIGPYRIEREIGRGGMGVVYLAERDDPTFQQRVALKVVRGGIPDGGRAHVARFLAERQLLASLEHAHIARLFDGGVTSDGLPYYTMAYCEGGSLADHLRVKGALPVDEALPIAGQLATALGAAHTRGVVHRDVKPGNVLFDADGSVRLTDFGIAKLLGDNVTHTGGVLGTAAYLSPEQATGETVDHRADLWAFGVTLYEMLSGRRPFDGSSYAVVLHRIVSTTPEPLRARLPGIDPELDALVMRLLQKNPSLRPESAEDVVRTLDAIAVGGDARTARRDAGHATPTTVKPAQASREPRRTARVIMGSAVALLAVVAGYAVWQGADGSSSLSTDAAPPLLAAGAPSVAVLPFANTSGAAADEPFTDGLTDELIGTLGRVRGLRVIARSSVFALKGSHLAARAIGDTLGVDHVVEGSVRRSGDSLRVLAQLVSVRNDSVLWSEQYDRQPRDVFAVQQEIARAIARALRVQLALGDEHLRAVEDPEALDLYLRGRFALNTRTGSADLLRAARLFEAAIARDSSYARAYSGLSDAYTSMGNFGYGRPGETFAKARANAVRALVLDSTLAEARTSLAHTMCVHDFAWEAADREFRRAIEQDPGYTFARMAFGVCLGARRRFDEALAQLDTARQSDPLRMGIGALRGRVLVGAGRPDEAIAALTHALDLNPQADLAWEQLGEAYLMKGQHADAIAAFRKAAELSGVRDSAQLAYALAVTGDRETAERIVRDLVRSSRTRYVPPFHIAMAYAGLGQVATALDWLEKAYEERASFISGINVTEAFKPLHRSPRWRQLVAKMGLERRQ
jgi:TolB-like protein/Tfp pilus assembly protein PilF